MVMNTGQRKIKIKVVKKLQTERKFELQHINPWIVPDYITFLVLVDVDGELEVDTSDGGIHFS